MNFRASSCDPQWWPVCTFVATAEPVCARVGTWSFPCRISLSLVRQSLGLASLHRGRQRETKRLLKDHTAGKRQRPIFSHLTHWRPFVSICWGCLYTDFPGGSACKESACNAVDLGSTSGLGRCPGEGNGNPLQYTCLWIPWTEEPGRLQSMGWQRVEHNWETSLSPL